MSGLFSYVFYRSMAAFALMLPVSSVFLFLRERRQRLKKRKLLLAQQFKEAMVILAASLSAGYAMENAMAVSLEELKLLYGPDGLIVQEFSGMVQQIRTNRNVEQVLLEFAGGAVWRMCRIWQRCWVLENGPEEIWEASCGIRQR